MPRSAWLLRYRQQRGETPCRADEPSGSFSSAHAAMTHRGHKPRLKPRLQLL